MQYTNEQLKEILEKHRKWINSEEGGERANLRYADLRSADLRSADLRYADLSSADLSSADLSSANLRYADLRSADLRSADLQKTILEGINWLAYIGIVPNENGKARAYKMITKEGQGPTYKGIDYLKTKSPSVETLDTDVNQLCSYGVNLATFQWCLTNKSDNGYRLLLMEFAVTPENLCCPIGSDGKFRVKQCTRIGECDWQGNLLQVQEK